MMFRKPEHKQIVKFIIKGTPCNQMKFGWREKVVCLDSSMKHYIVKDTYYNAVPDKECSTFKKSDIISWQPLVGKNGKVDPDMLENYDMYIRIFWSEHPFSYPCTNDTDCQFVDNINKWSNLQTILRYMPSFGWDSSECDAPDHFIRLIYDMGYNAARNSVNIDNIRTMKGMPTKHLFELPDGD